MKKAVAPADKIISLDSTDEEDAGKDDEYEIEEILEKEVKPFGKIRYKVKWVGWDAEVARRLTKNELNVVLLVSFTSSFEKFTNEQTSFLESNDFGHFL